MASILAALEWWRYYHPVKPNPAVYTVVALVCLVYFVFRVWRTWPQLRNLRLAYEGEKTVGQFLERLREQGYQVFHDVIGDGFNLDHVIIGPAGVFTVETKTWSKPAKGNPRIVFDGEQISVAGHAADRDPVVQAKAQSGWLRALLAESTGRTFSVKPVVVFPGWFIEQKPGAFREIWVLEPKALPAFLSNAPMSLTPEDVKLASYHLSQIIRANEQQK